MDPTKGKINSIQVGDEPLDIAVNPKTNKIYVANYGSHTVSIIDGELDKLLSKVSFNVNPPNSGRIICGKQEITTNIYNTFEFNMHCNADNNDGFRFTSWTEELGLNARRSINTSSVPDTPINSLKSAVGFTTNDTSSIFAISKFGNFTANFKEIPPPIPTEYWIALYGIITSSIIGWSIPIIYGLLHSRKQSKNLRQYANAIDSLHKKLNQNNGEELQSLDKMYSDITNTYAEGKMNETHYGLLKDKISAQCNRTYANAIDSLHKKLNQNNGEELQSLDKMYSDITNTYAEGKMNETHYGLLKDKISDFKNDRHKTNLER